MEREEMRWRYAIDRGEGADAGGQSTATLKWEIAQLTRIAGFERERYVRGTFKCLLERVSRPTRRWQRCWSRRGPAANQRWSSSGGHAVVVRWVSDLCMSANRHLIAQPSRHLNVRGGIGLVGNQRACPLMLIWADKETHQIGKKNFDKESIFSREAAAPIAIKHATYANPLT